MATVALERQLGTYLAHLTVERGLSVHTLAAYRRDLRRYIAFLTSRGVEDLAGAREADVEDFAIAIGTGGDERAVLATASAARTVVAVRGWHRFALAEGWVTVDVSARVKPRAQGMRLPKALDIAQVDALLAAARGDGPAGLRNRALVELMYATGARISEAVGIDVDDLELDPGAESVLLRGKGRKERVVPVGSLAVEAVQAYLVRARPALAARGGAGGALFLNTRGGRLSRQSGWAVIKTAAERAGVEGVSPHTLRHSFATHLLRGGADIRVVQELLGHASVTTTQVYTLVTRDALREAYQLAHPRALDPATARPE